MSWTILSIFAFLYTSCAYYNTFYNAEKLYSTAQKRLLNTQGKANQQAIEEYTQVIRKCGVVLTDYPKSKWAEEALLLLAKAYYYRGTNHIQALEQFESFLINYPDSKHFSEATIFSAKINFELNQKSVAFDILRSFIQNNRYRNGHPQALLQFADFYIQDKMYTEALYYLNMIIERYPKSKNYSEAYILLGLSYFDNQNFEQSLQTCTQFLSIKNTKIQRYDAEYYIALNLYHLKQFENAYKEVVALEKKEMRSFRLAEIGILSARINAELGRLEQAIEKLELIITDYPKTAFSAEAAFYMAEIQFLILQEYELAIENYNRVRRENAASEFGSRAVSRASVASQLLQYDRKNTSMKSDQLVAEHLKLADYYLYELSKPDSALVIYQRISEQRDYLQARIDSLLIAKIAFEEPTFEPDFTPYPPLRVNDPEDKAEEKEEFLYEEDYVEANGEEELSSIEEQFFLETSPSDDAESDSEIKEAQPFHNLQTIETELNRLYQELEQYESIYVPQSLFMKMVVYDQVYRDQNQVLLIISLLEEQYPENLYTEAATEYLLHEKVTYLTKHEKLQLESFERAMNYYLMGDEVYYNRLDEIIQTLDTLKVSTIPELVQQSLYTLGYIYHFDKSDTLNAKSYFDTLLVKYPTSKYSTNVKLFYDGEKFIRTERLQTIIDSDIKNEEDNAIEDVERGTPENSEFLENHINYSPQEKIDLPPDDLLPLSIPLPDSL